MGLSNEELKIESLKAIYKKLENISIALNVIATATVLITWQIWWNSP